MRMSLMAIVLGMFVLSTANGQDVVPFKLGNAGHIVVSARVNDTTGTFILDTGAGIHVVSPRFLRRLAPTPVSAGLFTGFRHNGERLDSELFQAHTMAIGGQIQAAPVMGIYAPLEQWGIDGLVSMKFFQDRTATIDMQRKEIRFEDADGLRAIVRKAEVIPLSFHEDRGVLLDLFVRLIVQDSVEIEAEFDTGAGFETVLLNPFYLNRLGIDTTGAMKEATSERPGGPVRGTLTARVTSLQYANAPTTRVQNVNVVFKEGLIYEGLIGSGAFRGKRLTIDLPNRRMLVW